MLQWDYGQIKGYMVYKDDSENPLYKGNCLAVEVKDKRWLQGFWNDIFHLYRMLGLEQTPYLDKRDYYEGVLLRVRLSCKYEENIEIGKAFEKAGYPVEFYDLDYLKLEKGR